MGMDFLTALNVSGSALSAERVRVNLASSNLANAETTRDANGNMYKRLDPVFESLPMGDAKDIAPDATGPMGVRVSRIAADGGPGRKVYSPGHPDADPDGFVTFPDVNPVHEVVNLMSASRAYDANAVAVETLKQMAARGLEITK
jgi:flagellar basal-body rod protein FlgC